MAAIALLVCVVLDSLDGNVARLTRTTSRFGAEFDSLTDVVVFGCIPALIIYDWSLATMAELGWLWAKLGWFVQRFSTPSQPRCAWPASTPGSRRPKSRFFAVCRARRRRP